jgi:hypothetical protein
MEVSLFVNSIKTFVTNTIIYFICRETILYKVLQNVYITFEITQIYDNCSSRVYECDLHNI